MTSVLALSLILLAPRVSADELHFRNGDRLTGRIVSEVGGQIVIEHEAAGTMTVDSAFVDRIVRQAAAEAAEAAARAGTEPVWTRELALGYNLRRGNTIDEDLSGRWFAKRKTGHDEFTTEARGAYSEANRRMDAQQYSGMVRYAFSFGPRLAWYNFYKLEGEHDRFENVDLRFIPTTGVGYWLSDTEDLKAMAELGLGWEQTNFRGTTPNRGDVVLAPRAFAAMTLFGNSVLSQDMTVWPNLSDGEYRLRSETVFTNPLREDLALRLTFIDEFQSEPATETQKNDARLISSLVYSF